MTSKKVDLKAKLNTVEVFEYEGKLYQSEAKALKVVAAKEIHVFLNEALKQKTLGVGLQGSTVDYLSANDVIGLIVDNKDDFVNLLNSL